MTDACKECKYRKLCEENADIGYKLDQEDKYKCERYYDYLEGEEEYD